MQMRTALTTELDFKGIEHDSGRPFKPHITLARNADSPSDLPFEPFQWVTERIVLAQSPPLGEGPLLVSRRHVTMA